LVTTRQSVVVTKQDTTTTRNGIITKPEIDQEESYSHDVRQNNDINKLLDRVKPTDLELLYSRLPVDIIPTMDNPEPLTQDQQMLHAKIIAAELERQGYVEEDDYEEEDDYDS
jgi:hypothetical protein